ncbi:hypothetical protein, partial [Bacillus thuringiensis]|uniref:hypothetical protein n=1 Tax=Bacillus thuringiensis TaxID=1428 RepID=UPI000C02712F
GSTGPTGVVGPVNMMLERNLNLTNVAANTVLPLNSVLVNNGGSFITFNAGSGSVTLLNGFVYAVSYSYSVIPVTPPGNITVKLQLDTGSGPTNIPGSGATLDAVNNIVNISGTILVDLTGASNPGTITMFNLGGANTFVFFSNTSAYKMSIIKIS